MFNKLKESVDDEIYMSNSYCDYSKFCISTERFGLEVKISTNATGELVSVSKYKNKDMTKPGKFKIDSIKTSYTIPSFEMDDISKFLVKTDGSHYSPEWIYVDMADVKNNTFAEMSEPAYYLDLILKKYKKIEEFNTKYNKSDSVYTSLEED